LKGAEFFRQRPNFLVDLAEKFGQELATLVPSSQASHGDSSAIEISSPFLKTACL
jgi:hypothetical protein